MTRWPRSTASSASPRARSRSVASSSGWREHRPPGARMTAEAAPAQAARVFGDRLELACRYADLLCTVGVDRGLVGPREPARIWRRHLLNSAQLADFVPHAVRVLDVGAGAGLPGIPLLLARPDLKMTLVEPMLRR